MEITKQASPSPIRIPEDLKRWIKLQATNNHRSFSGEVVVRLKESRKQQENLEDSRFKQ